MSQSSLKLYNAVESPEPCKAEVKGNIPGWLQGTLLRTGPGIFSVGETSYNHWFDGMAIMNSFNIKDGEVIHRSKFLKGDTYQANMAAKRIVISEMGTMAYPDPSKNLIFKAITFLNHTVPDFTDNGANNFIKYGNDYYATSETNYIRKIDPVTLETQEKYLPANLVSSHPHYDKEGNAYNIGTSIAEKGKTKYMIFKVPAASEKGMTVPVLKNVQVLCTIPCRHLLTPSYYHSFGMTDNYIIFMEQPLKLDIVKMATAYMRGVSWASCVKFCPEENSLIHLIDRRTGKEVETKYQTGTMIVYHHVNAFEDDGHVVFDVIAYNDNSLYDMFYFDKLNDQSGSSNKNYSKPSYKRFALIETHSALQTFDFLYFRVTFMHFSPTGIDLPRINYDFNGKRHRFVYGSIVKESALTQQVGKFDTETKEMVYWNEEDCLPSEPVFIPRPNGESEDDGVVLLSVINGKPGQPDFLLFLDGKTFKEVARAYVKAELCKDMHGFFIPQGQ
uniref:Beta-carotene oxygenase 1 n=1 Tax=Salarias fasciatus TaxID=181472 RepID=A0A672IM17_SALFA